MTKRILDPARKVRRIKKIIAFIVLSALALAILLDGQLPKTAVNLGAASFLPVVISDEVKKGWDDYVFDRMAIDFKNQSILPCS